MKRANREAAGRVGVELKRDAEIAFARARLRRDSANVDTVERVREMWGKHASLNINQTVLVSRNGFTSEAERFAESKGVLTMSLEKAVSAEWSSWLESMANLRIAVVTFAPLDLTIRVLGARDGEIATNPDTRVRWTTLAREGTVKGLLGINRAAL